MTATVTLHSFESRCHELPQTSQTAVWKSHTSTPYCSDTVYTRNTGQNENFI